MDAETPKRLVDLAGTKPRQDWLSAAGAYALAEEIRAYWKSRGAEIAVRVQQIRMPSAGENVKLLYAVRSSLVRGLPFNWTAERLRKTEYV